MHQATAEKLRNPHDADAVVAALLSGGDSRVAIDPVTGTNKYLCQPKPVSGVICFSSCTASPIDARGFARAADVFQGILAATSPGARAKYVAAQARRIEARLLDYFGVTHHACASLHPSGTDALLAASLRVAAQHPGKKLTALLPIASETGTGVGRAATCRYFDGPHAGAALSDSAVDAIEVPLRSAAGAPLPADELDARFSDAAKTASGRPVLILTHGTKTGLVAPASPPPGIDVIVDACQARITPERVADYLRRGWPVVVTGSKFFCGPAFSGAVLVPRAHFRPVPRQPDVSLGTVLRWTAALDAIDDVAARSPDMAARLQSHAAALDTAFLASDSLVPIGGLQSRGPGWDEMPSLFTFAVRDPACASRLLPAAELQPLYRRLAHAGVLLGQPVSLGAFGGLRIAFGARDLISDPVLDNLPRVFEALADAIRDIGR